MWKTIAAAVGGVTAAVVSALCCVGPPVAVALGVSGAGLAGTFEPLRPWFLGATGAFLGGGFWLLHQEERKACEPGRLCASPTARRRMRVALWIATAAAAALTTFPVWSGWVLS
jgi:mercuric ion transport protein